MIGNYLPAFEANLSNPFSTVKQSKKNVGNRCVITQEIYNYAPVADVSGQPVGPIFKGQEVHEECWEQLCV